MVFYVLGVLVGITLLVLSAKHFVDGAVFLAQRYRIPPILIGTCIIGFGTSAPEIVVSIIASIQGNSGIALGNAVGSNIANIGLILGCAVLYRPIRVQLSVLKRELVQLILASVLIFILMINFELSRLDGLMILFTFVVFMAWNIRQDMKFQSSSTSEQGSSCQLPLAVQQARPIIPILKLVLGLIVLVLSSRLLVWGAVEIAYYFRVSDLIVGLTVVAIGTSLPELASSLIAAHRGEHELVIGNVLGSNLFNMMVVIGLSAGITPIALDTDFLMRDYMVMGLFISALTLFCLIPSSPRSLGRVKGGVLFLGFIAYTLYLVLTSI